MMLDFVLGFEKGQISTKITVVVSIPDDELSSSWE